MKEDKKQEEKLGPVENTIPKEHQEVERVKPPKLGEDGADCVV